MTLIWERILYTMETSSVTLQNEIQQVVVCCLKEMYWNGSSVFFHIKTFFIAPSQTLGFSFNNKGAIINWSSNASCKGKKIKQQNQLKNPKENPFVH